MLGMSSIKYHSCVLPVKAVVSRIASANFAQFEVHIGSGNIMRKLKSAVHCCCLLIVLFLLFKSANLNKLSEVLYRPAMPTEVAREYYAVLGGTADAKYLFPLPITVRTWARLGIKSIVCFSGLREDYEKSSSSAVVIQELDNLKVAMIFLDTKLAPAHTISQTCRLFVAASPDLSLSRSDVLVTSDSDLWPFHRHNHLPSDNQTIFLYNSMCCSKTGKPGSKRRQGKLFRMYPMSTIAMSVNQWMTFMNVSMGWLTSGDVLAKRLYAEFDESFIRDGRGKPDITMSWYADQILVSEVIDNWLNKSAANRLTMGQMTDKPRRIDRRSWKIEMKDLMDLSSYDDAHIPVSLHSRWSWSSSQPLLRLLFNEAEMDQIERYHSNFMATI